jgi:hypothetical protein
MKNVNTTIVSTKRRELLEISRAGAGLSAGGGALRDLEDDFFCLRFRVWYPSFDCAIRTRYKTCPSCRDCEQGRFNLKRHGSELAKMRNPFGRR